MGLALAKIEMILCASPQGLALGRQRSGYLRQAHFMTSSKKGLSEPSWVGQVENYTESGDLQSQQDSFWALRAITETILASRVGK
jgi:hypothetical protein